MICETDFGSFWGLLIDLLALLADSETLCLFHSINVHLHVDTKISMTPDSQKLIQSPVRIHIINVSVSSFRTGTISEFFDCTLYVGHPQVHMDYR